MTKSGLKVHYFHKNQKTLANLLVLDPSTMSRDIKKLESKKWVSVGKGADPRNSVLSITDEGFVLLEKIAPIWEELHHKVAALLGSFSLQQVDGIMMAISSKTEELRM